MIVFVFLTWGTISKAAFPLFDVLCLLHHPMDWMIWHLHQRTRFSNWQLQLLEKTSLLLNIWYGIMKTALKVICSKNELLFIEKNYPIPTKLIKISPLVTDQQICPLLSFQKVCRIRNIFFQFAVQAWCHLSPFLNDHSYSWVVNLLQ